jgi:hypothetical protein
LLNFLKENDVTIGVIIGSLLLPLIADFVKRRWDRQKEERERRVLDFRDRQQATLTKRLEIVDDITNSYMEFLINIQFIVLDFEQKRLESVLGQQHRSSYDELAQAFLAKSSIFPLRVAQYFERSNILEQRMHALEGWAGEADAAITLLAENPPELSKEEMENRWRSLQIGTGKLSGAVRETLRELSAEVKPDAEFAEDQAISWSVLEIKEFTEARTYPLR